MHMQQIETADSIHLGQDPLCYINPQELLRLHMGPKTLPLSSIFVNLALTEILRSLEGTAEKF